MTIIHPANDNVGCATVAPPGAADPWFDSPRARSVAATVIVAWAVVSTIVGRLGTVFMSGPLDSALFAYMGLEWTHGYIPYLHHWDNKPPGIFAISALTFSAFPRSFVALAVVEGLFVGACILTIYLLMKRCGAPWSVVWLATGMVAMVANLSFYNEGGNLTEIYLLFPEALSVYFIVRFVRAGRMRDVFLSGLFAGIACWFKPVGLAGFFAAIVYLSLLTVRKVLPFRRLAAAVAAMTAGCSAIWIASILYFARNGVAASMLNASFVHNLRYGATNQRGLTLLIAFDQLSVISVVVAAAGLGVVLFLRHGRALWTHPSSEIASEGHRWELLWPLIAAWMAFDLAGAMGGGRNFPHYFLPVCVSLSVGAAFAFWMVLAQTSERRSLYFAAALVLGSLLLVQERDWAESVRTYKHTDLRGASVVQIADELEKLRKPGDTLFVWSFDPLIYYLTGMETPVRQTMAFRIYHHPWAYNIFGNQILGQLQAQPPRFLVDCTQPCIAGRSDPGTRLRAPWLRTDPIYARFREMVAQDYGAVYTSGNLTLYERKTAHP